MNIDFSPIEPYQFQHEIYNKTIEHIKSSGQSGYIYASVSAGKTIMMAMICKRAQQMAEAAGRPPMRILALARTGELVEQNAHEMWNMGVRNSIFSASVGIKKLKYPVIVGSEGTVARALDKEMKLCTFDLLLIDECLIGETLISTKKGMVMIKDLTVDDEIFCMNEQNGDVMIDKPVRVFSNGIRGVSTITHKDGELTCTSTHKLLSKNLWVCADQLQVGDYLTLNGSQDFAMKKLLRAVVAVTKKLLSAPKKKMTENQY